MKICKSRCDQLRACGRLVLKYSVNTDICFICVTVRNIISTLPQYTPNFNFFLHFYWTLIFISRNTIWWIIWISTNWQKQRKTKSPCLITLDTQFSKNQNFSQYARHQYWLKNASLNHLFLQEYFVKYFGGCSNGVLR